MLEAKHVEQRHLNHNRIPHPRVLRELDAHQQAAIRSADNAEPARRSDFSRDQILGDRIEVVVNALAVSLEASLMPCRAELATAANIGQHINSAMLQPELARHRMVVRRIRDLESAISGQQSRIRAVVANILAMYHEVRHLGSILRCRFELLDDIGAGVKLRLLRLRYSE